MSRFLPGSLLSSLLVFSSELIHDHRVIHPLFHTSIPVIFKTKEQKNKLECPESKLTLGLFIRGPSDVTVAVTTRAKHYFSDLL